MLVPVALRDFRKLLVHHFVWLRVGQRVERVVFPVDVLSGTHLMALVQVLFVLLQFLHVLFQFPSVEVELLHIGMDLRRRFRNISSVVRAVHLCIFSSVPVSSCASLRGHAQSLFVVRFYFLALFVEPLKGNLLQMRVAIGPFMAIV